MIEPAFRLILKAAPAVAPLVSERIYFVVAAQNERRPRLVLTLVSSQSGHTFQGRGGYVIGRMQIDCLAPTYPEAKALAKAAKDALEGFTGTVDTTVIDYIEPEDARDIPVAPPQGSELPTTYGVSFDARFMHKE